MIADRPASSLYVIYVHKGSNMVTMTEKSLLICAIAIVLSVVPYSIDASRIGGITIDADQAQAVIGRPLTPGSVAGVARRTARRHAYYGHHYYGHHHCVWVVVNGVRVCR
jgi:hypothetical protein